MSFINRSADFSQTGNWKKGNRLFLIISWHSESQQVAINCNIIRSVIQVGLILFQICMICRVELLGSVDMQMFGDSYIVQKG